MNKLQWIEIIQNKLGGGSVTADIKEKYRDGVVRIHCGIAFDELILRVFQNSINASVSDLDAYSKPFSVGVPTNLDGDTGMLVLPINTITKASKLLQIPNNKAIRRIIATELHGGNPTLCFYRDWGMSDVYANLEVTTYLSNPRYSVMGNNIYLSIPISLINLVMLRILMIVPFSEWDDTEELPAPLENNVTIIEEVCQRLLNMPPEDKIIDDNDVQV